VVSGFIDWAHRSSLLVVRNECVGPQAVGAAGLSPRAGTPRFDFVVAKLAMAGTKDVEQLFFEDKAFRAGDVRHVVAAPTGFFGDLFNGECFFAAHRGDMIGPSPVARLALDVAEEINFTRLAVAARVHETNRVAPDTRSIGSLVAVD